MAAGDKILHVTDEGNRTFCGKMFNEPTEGVSLISLGAATESEHAFAKICHECRLSIRDTYQIRRLPEGRD